MNRVEIISDNFDIELWNSIAIHPMQSWEWGEAKKEIGNKVIRVGLFENDNLINVFLFTLHKLPKVNKFIGYMPMCDFATIEVLQFLSNFCKENNVVFIKMEPYINALRRTELIKNAKDSNVILQKSPHPMLFNWTMVLDLEKSEEELLNQMKQKTRYNVRLAEKKGVIANYSNDYTSFNTFVNLFFDTAKRRGYISHTRKYHEIIWKHLKDKIAHLITVSYNNTPLGAFELFSFNGTLYYPYGGTSNEHRNLMSANLLMWESIKLGKRLGAKRYDMWGANPPDPLHPDFKPYWDGFTKFKDGYGPEYVELIGCFDLVANKNLYKVYNIADKLRKIYLSKKIQSFN